MFRQITGAPERNVVKPKLLRMIVGLLRR